MTRELLSISADVATLALTAKLIVFQLVRISVVAYAKARSIAAARKTIDRRVRRKKVDALQRYILGMKP